MMISTVKGRLRCYKSAHQVLVPDALPGKATPAENRMCVAMRNVGKTDELKLLTDTVTDVLLYAGRIVFLRLYNM